MIITEKKVLEIKDNVKCPQLGSVDYGKWGALRVEQRELINDLCDCWMYKNILLDNYIKNWNELKKFVEADIKRWEDEEKKWIEHGFMKFGGEANNKIIFKKVLNKMQELEQGKDE